MANIPPWRKSPSPTLRARAKANEGPTARELGASPVLAPSHREHENREDAQHALIEKAGRHRLLDDHVDAAALGAMSVEVAAEHIMLRLARRRSQLSRTALVDEVTELLLGLSEDRFLKRVLLGLADAGRIVDVYPLELLFRVRERAPDRVPFAQLSAFVKNKAELEARVFEVGEPIQLQIPLAMRIRAFALEGGGFPGYVFSPGPPAEYELELHAPGEFLVLLRGEVRKAHLLDRIRLKVALPSDG